MKTTYHRATRTLISASIVTALVLNLSGYIIQEAHAEAVKVINNTDKTLNVKVVPDWDTLGFCRSNNHTSIPPKATTTIDFFLCAIDAIFVEKSDAIHDCTLTLVNKGSFSLTSERDNEIYSGDANYQLPAGLSDTHSLTCK